VDDEAFLAHADAGGFLEWAVVHGDYKGTPRLDPPPGRDVLLEIDVQGARQVRDRHPDALIVFIEPPSRREQERRLRDRGDSGDVIARRLADAPGEEALGEEIADHVVVNDDLEDTIGEMLAIIDAARHQA
jgi:guanylate kinase